MGVFSVNGGETTFSKSIDTGRYGYFPVMAFIAMKGLGHR